MSDPGVMTLRLRRRGGGGLVVESPELPGWGVAVRGPIALAKAVEAAWVELDVAAYAARRGQAYDLAHHVDRPATPPRLQPIAATGPSRWRLKHSPADWVPLPDGRWRSPSGRVYRAGTEHVTRVVAARVAAGLPVTAAPEPTDQEEAG